MRISALLLLRLAFVLVMLIGIALSMKSIREPDLWWQLRTGEWMLDNHQVTKTDVFSFSYEGTPWVNVKWGYEILQAWISKSGGPEMIPVLQVIMTTLLLIILINNTKGFGKVVMGPDYRPGYGSILALLGALWIIENRITGRPEAVSHLFTAAYAFLFIHHRSKPSMLIFLIVPIQILWTNLHEAYGVGIVIAGIFTAAAWFEFIFLRNKTWFGSPAKMQLPWIISLASVMAFAAIAINPRGILLWWHPLEIFSQLGENKFTIELYSFRMQEYWNYRSVLALIGAIISIRFLLSRLGSRVSQAKKQLKSWQHAINKAGIGYILFFLACLYLSLSANRNIPFLIIAGLPLIATSWDKSISELRLKIPRFKPASIVIPLSLIFYISVVSGYYYKVFNPRDRFGLEINVEKTPHGAASFIHQHQIQGRAFTDFLSSSFLLWYLQPSYKTYIDLRDLDIFPAVFFENNFKLYQFPDRVFPYADADMQFDYIVLLNEPFLHGVHKYLLTTPTFDLVYADLLASVYLRKNAHNQTLIDSLGFRSTGHDVFHGFRAIPPSQVARVMTKLLNPFHSFHSYNRGDEPLARKAYYQYLGYAPQHL